MGTSVVHFWHYIYISVSKDEFWSPNHRKQFKIWMLHIFSWRGPKALPSPEGQNLLPAGPSWQRPAGGRPISANQNKRSWKTSLKFDIFVQKLFCTQNEAMDLTYQMSYVFAFLNVYSRINWAKTLRFNKIYWKFCLIWLEKIHI